MGLTAAGTGGDAETAGVEEREDGNQAEGNGNEEGGIVRRSRSGFWKTLSKMSTDVPEGRKNGAETSGNAPLERFNRRFGQFMVSVEVSTWSFHRLFLHFNATFRLFNVSLVPYRPDYLSLHKLPSPDLRNVGAAPRGWKPSWILSRWTQTRACLFTRMFVYLHVCLPACLFTCSLKTKAVNSSCMRRQRRDVLLEVVQARSCCLTRSEETLGGIRDIWE